MKRLRMSNDWLEVLQAARDDQMITVGCTDEGCDAEGHGIPMSSTLRVVDIGDNIDMSIDVGGVTIWSETAAIKRKSPDVIQGTYCEVPNGDAILRGHVTGPRRVVADIDVYPFSLAPPVRLQDGMISLSPVNVYLRAEAVEKAMRQ